MKKVKFSFLGALKKIIDLCRPHAIETDTGDINKHENTSFPKPPVHKTYYRKYNTKENNDEFPRQSPKKNKELEVQSPDIHEEIPRHSLEKNEKLLVQSPKNHEKSPKQSLDFVTINVVHARTTLKELHRHVDGGHWKEVTDSAMEQTVADFSIPQDVLDIILQKQLAIKYDCFVSFIQGLPL